jgi:hypothetical protein
LFSVASQCLLPCINARSHRLALLGGDVEAYTCCAGMFGAKVTDCSLKCTKSCPAACLCCEACCCPALAASANREWLAFDKLRCLATLLIPGSLGLSGALWVSLGLSGSLSLAPSLCSVSLSLCSLCSAICSLFSPTACLFVFLTLQNTLLFWCFGFFSNPPRARAPQAFCCRRSSGSRTLRATTA